MLKELVIPEVYKFWQEALNESYKDYQALCQHLKDKNQEYYATPYFIPILLHIHRTSVTQVLLGVPDVRSILNLIRTASVELHSYATVLPFGDWSIFLSLPSFLFPATYHRKRDAVKGTVLSLISAASKHVSFNYSCYIGSFNTIAHMDISLSALKNAFNSHVLPANSISFLSDLSLLSPTSEREPFFDLQHWVDLMNRRQAPVLFSEIDRVLETSFSGSFNRTLALQFYQDFLQVCSASLYCNGIFLHSVIEESDRIQKEGSTVRSLHELKRFCIRISSSVMEAIVRKRDQMELVERIRSYVYKNIDNGLTRQSVADYFYIHPDYLSHLFRKKTKTTFSSLLQEARIERSKQLLSNTSKSIAEIAQQIGYSNPSHFCVAFQRIVGQTPSAFRRCTQGKNSS